MRPPRPAPLFLFILLCIALSGAACGPVEYINQVTRRASQQLAAARESGAEKNAPYEYTSALEYLHKAREEAGYADYQAAIRFGRRAEEMAYKARQIAMKLSEQSEGTDDTTHAADEE